MAEDTLSRRRSWVWMILAAAMCVVGAWVFASWMSDYQSPDAALGEAIAETDRIDPGWKFDEMEEGADRLPLDQNLATAMAAAGSLIPFAWTAPAGVEDPATTGTPQRQIRGDALAALESAVSPVLATAEKLKEAIPLATGRYAIEPRSDVFVTSSMSHLSTLKTMRRILWNVAIVDIQRGRFDDGCMRGLAILAVGRSIGDEMAAYSQQLRIDTRLMAIDPVERSLAQGRVSDGVLAEVQRQLATEAQVHPLAAAVKGERARLDKLYCNFENKAESIERVTKLVGFERKTTTTGQPSGQRAVKLQHAWILRHMNKLQAATKLPPPERLRQIQRAAAEMSEVPNDLAWFLMPDFTPIAESDERSSVCLEAAAAGVAVERYRLKHGQWPQSLQEVKNAKLMAAIPTDPYSGKPIQFRKTADGVVIYSVGPDESAMGESWLVRQRSAVRYEFRLWDEAARRLPAGAG
jgi:hypothetical protein